MYILNDVCMVWTQQYTLYYATAMSHAATVKLQCQIDQMEFQLECRSVVVSIGRVDRFYAHLASLAICNLVAWPAAYQVARRRGVPCNNPSLLLSAGAKYLFDATHLVHDDVYYIDPVSALLNNGLVSIRWGRRHGYMLDNQLWRILQYGVEDDTRKPRHLASAIPLVH
ncbi:Aste57867_14433 [Aphanomyces stellatus]|uniref:Aste57867_14433 protein n=1 Tax=Aphanomyces stellatus TaxID=120398 RepID=A0A485KH63_9STRA|nr:hypothetical protein As57867_014379 [Aphanomyces stellatus]KAF0705273.1 hypothetical protein As57867_007058 [Aphanomyces stellatus]KAF0709917.1 hypothetical protein As57867_005696 [Aphanomyces stellatus]VFT82748.1 Aste57867_5709 [Aphanomyces stellatus]VFT84020.1 Aste57867_7081 [Aphanomyces stellatus]